MKRALRSVIPYEFRIELRRGWRGLQNAVRWPKAVQKTVELQEYPKLLVQHSSKLLREVHPRFSQLQINKVRNLRLGCLKMNGILIAPGQIFSFCKLVGRTTYRRGYVDGLEMHRGELIGAPGGGLCQLANLIYWLAVQLDLEILERHRHELDLFPDDDRVVPFGMGASVFYNYHDLRFRNTLNQPLVLAVSVSEPLLRGAFFSDRDKDFEVRITEAYDRFIRRENGQVWRENRVLCSIHYRDGRCPSTREIAHNFGRVCYEVPESALYLSEQEPSMTF